MALPARYEEPQASSLSPLFVVSQRGPFSFSVDDTGCLEQQCAGGGLASAFTALACREPITWVAAAMSEGDRVAARRAEGWPLGRSRVHLLGMPRTVQELHYSAFANPLLWLVQHDMARDLVYPRSMSEIERAWEHGYRPANQLLAERVVAACDTRRPVVLVQDYQLYLVPRMIRRLRPDALIAHFVHIPWPDPGAWSCLPEAIVIALMEGLLGADLVGFQTTDDAGRFLATCQAYGVDPENTLVRHYPITVDRQGLERQAHVPEVQQYMEQAACNSGVQTIVRVDRLDPTKNVAVGFEAFGRLLDQSPSLHGRVRFIAHLVPSRDGLAEYQRAAERAFAAADAVNHRLGSADWQPIEIFFEENRDRAYALLRDYDVLLVNSVADGMNLVAKEGAVLNQRDGVLVLSHRAGAWQELGSWAIGVEPCDVDGTTRALSQALSMSGRERAGRAAGLREAVSRTSLDRWLGDQLGELRLAQESSLALPGRCQGLRSLVPA